MLDIDKIYKTIIQAAEEWSAADDEARKLKEMQKVILSEIINHTEGESFAERKSIAQASPEYKLHVTNMVTAKTKANLALARYKAAQSLGELRRSEESTRRAEMRL